MIIKIQIPFGVNQQQFKVFSPVNNYIYTDRIEIENLGEHIQACQNYYANMVNLYENISNVSTIDRYFINLAQANQIFEFDRFHLVGDIIDTDNNLPYSQISLLWISGRVFLLGENVRVIICDDSGKSFEKLIGQKAVLTPDLDLEKEKFATSILKNSTIEGLYSGMHSFLIQHRTLGIAKFTVTSLLQDIGYITWIGHYQDMYDQYVEHYRTQGKLSDELANQRAYKVAGRYIGVILKITLQANFKGQYLVLKEKAPGKFGGKTIYQWLY
jgi:hypothetical protein